MRALNVYNPVPDVRESFWKKAGIPARGNRLYQALREGLPYTVYGKLAELAGLDKKQLAKITVIASATLQRRAKSGRFTQDESDRLYRFAEVLKAAEELFEGNIERASHWLKQPVTGLGGRRPVEMLATSAETEAVLDLIGRLEHGVIA